MGESGWVDVGGEGVGGGGTGVGGVCHCITHTCTTRSLGLH